MKAKKIRMPDINLIQLYSLCFIPMLLVFVFSYLPMFGIIIAFKDYSLGLGIMKSPWNGLDNFTYFFRSDAFWKIAWNTVSLNLIFIFAGLIAQVALAILLFNISKRVYVKIYQTIYITPNFLSWVVVGYMAYAFLNPEYGFINKMLEAVGLQGVAWYSRAELWPWILTFFSIWKSVGINAVIYYAALMGIDKTLFEAAEIDGAGKWTVIKAIIIPVLVPLMVTLTILAIGGIFRADFGMFYQLTRDIGTLYSTTDVMDTYIFRTMRVIGDMSTSAAAGLLQSVVGFVMVILTNKLAKLLDPENGLF